MLTKRYSQWAAYVHYKNARRVAMKKKKRVYSPRLPTSPSSFSLRPFPVFLTQIFGCFVLLLGAVGQIQRCNTRWQYGSILHELTGHYARNETTFDCA